jgi:hypothetical protein
MQPARLDLPVVPGTTYRDTMRLMQPEFAYRAITGITQAPARVAVPGHGLEESWPVWIRGVAGLPSANREPPAALPHRATVVDANTLEINSLSAVGVNATGGQLLYRLPIDLTGAEVLMLITGLAGEDIELTLGAGLVVPSPGTISRVLMPDQTELLVGEWRYTVDVMFANGDIVRYYEGGPATPAGCHG